MTTEKKVKTRKSVRYEFLHKYGIGRVFTKEQADAYFGYNAQISINLIMKNGLATRVRRGLYYIFNWGETKVEQNRDFFVPHIGKFVIGYWSALKKDTKDTYLLSTRKQRFETEVINGVTHHYLQLGVNRINKNYVENGVTYLNKNAALVDCILDPKYTPGVDVLKDYIRNEVNIDEVLSSTELLKGHYNKAEKKYVKDFLNTIKAEKEAVEA